MGNNVGGGRAISSCLLMICIRTARRDEIGDVCVRGGIGARITDCGWSVSWWNQSWCVSDVGMMA